MNQAGSQQVAQAAIRELPAPVAAQIAAGEVIERPAAVLKELLENALDAGANRIEVELNEAGRQRIAVHDDGNGIPPEQLRLAVGRHATSKLRTVDDLSQLTTYGFRGEALPAIAAAAGRLTVTTRARSQPAAALIEYECGRLVREQTGARAPGTSVEVWDLFQGQPARRAFLAKPRAERQALVRVASDVALAEPQRALRLTIDGRTPLAHEPAAGGSTGAHDLEALRGALASVFRAGVAERALAFSAEHSGMGLDGWCGSPEDVRRQRDGIRLFVNGRPVHDRRLAYAVQEAYRDWLPSGGFPIAVVRLRVPPASVDVNVHPAKTEVKLRQPELAFSLVQRTIRSALAESRRRTPLRLASDALEFAEDAGSTQPLLRVRPQGVSALPPANAVAEASPGQLVELAPEHRSLPSLRTIGQMHRTFIVAEGPDGLLLVDQHAAHERVLYERLLSQSSEPQARQPLIQPITLELDAAEAANWNVAAARLESLGFELDPFGERALILRSLPKALDSAAAEQLLRGILRDAGDRTAEPARFDPVTASAACHGSVRRGSVLDSVAMSALLRDLERCENPHSCPRGRPTLVEIAAEDLLRRFRRK